ncbi:hypothetical protein ES319_A12G231600v1 [Gossypium barbadense]|uniref:Uncharacterized protein n=2 Tax=Gossypium TaxID=3633 RepID=A0A5J5TDZ4_GOSBA|nr:hypothetical protein ES319_A12G231600v1 [Gossypium barbadense]TYG91314.1 hypothetical protein ES288_A12G252200v1 [Gossypium darwinii]
MCPTSSVVTTMTSHLILALALLLLADGLAGCGFSNPACIGSSDHSHSSPYFKQRWLELCLGLVSLRFGLGLFDLVLIRMKWIFL